jgi:hypothetical protein
MLNKTDQRKHLLLTGLKLSLLLFLSEKQVVGMGTAFYEPLFMEKLQAAPATPWQCP